MTSKHRGVKGGRATTTLLTRILTLLKQRDMNKKELNYNLHDSFYYQIKDGLRWLLNHKLIKSYKPYKKGNVIFYTLIECKEDNK